jgi:NAD(P)-dependent dehydrogenase (short-subunit alcohol dehydrogenase family)/aryl carrier-like protein
VHLPATVDRTALQEALEQLAPAQQPLEVIFWGEPSGSDAAPTHALAACSTLLTLSQTLSTLNLPVRLWVVTRGAQGDDGTHRVDAGARAVGGSLWGFGRTLQQEEPRLGCRLVDLDGSEALGDQLRAVRQELAYADQQATQVRWRGGERAVAQLQRWSAAVGRGMVRLREDGSYLITGGLGALGLEVAQQLVTDGARRLLLVGRGGVATERQRVVLTQLAATGAMVEVIAADIADADAVAQLVARCTDLRGIVHAAGVLDDRLVSSQTPARFTHVFRPKADGAWLLHQATQGLALDFFVAFSSVAALVGNAGQANYAAANGFLDGLMQARRAMGLPGLSINWGPWAEVGMAAGLERALQRQGMGVIPPAQGRQLFGYLLQRTEELPSQVGVLPQRISQTAPSTREALRFDRQAYARRSPDEQQALLVDLLQQTLMRVGGFSTGQLSPTQDLLSIGLDSLMAIEWRKQIEELFAVDIPLSHLLEGGSLVSVASRMRLMWETLPKILTQATGKPPASQPVDIRPDLTQTSINQQTSRRRGKL